MVQQCLAWLCELQTSLVLAWLWLKSAKELLLLARGSANQTCHVQNQPHRAFMACQHHSLDPYGGNEMVQQCLAWCAGGNQPWFWLGSCENLSNFLARNQAMIGHGMSKFSITEPS